MSGNQSRAERSESSSSGQYRRTGRSGNSSNQPRTNSSTSGPKAAGGSTLSSNRSFNKKYNNVQGGGGGAQARAINPNVSNLDSGNPIVGSRPAVQNGAHPPQQQQPSARGVSDASVTAANTNKPADVPAQKVTRDVPKAPTSHVSGGTSDSAAPSTTAKAPGDASRSFPLQFGSINPGFMNGVPIPARTSSAPPNLDEQKRAQARHESLRAAAPGLPSPSIPRQQQLPPRKESGTVEQSVSGEAHSISTKAKREVPVSAVAPVPQAQKPSVHTISGMPMQMPYHQPQVPLQFGGPNPQIQSQSMSGTSMPMPMPMAMPLPMGNPPVQQPMFVSGIQPHPMQSQTIIHQGQSLAFSSPMGPQLPPQIGSMGISMGQQYSPQPSGKFGAQRKAVKITHPDTHEELRLDGSSGSRSHPNVPPQSQPLSSYPPGHPMHYYSNSYNASSVYFPTPSSLPLSNTQIAPSSQPPRSYNQVTVKPPASAHGEKESSVSVSLPVVGKGETPKISRPQMEDLPRLQKDSQASSQISLQQSKPASTTTSVQVVSRQSAVQSASCVGSSEPSSSSSTSATLTPIVDPASIPPSGLEGTRNETIGGPDSTKDLKRPASRGRSSMQEEVLGQPAVAKSTQAAESELMHVKASSSSGSVPIEGSNETLPSADAGDGFRDITSKTDLPGGENASEFLESADSKQLKPDTLGREEQTVSTEAPTKDNKIEQSLENSSGTPKTLRQHEDGSFLEEITPSCEVTSSEIADKKLGETARGCAEDDGGTDSSLTSTVAVDAKDAEALQSLNGLSGPHHDESDLHASLCRPDGPGTKEVASAKSAVLHQDSDLIEDSSSAEATLRYGEEVLNDTSAELVSPSSPSVKDKALLEPNLAKSNVPRVKKKKFFKRVEAVVTDSDILTAFKGPEEKKEAVASGESTADASSGSLKQRSDDVSHEHVIISDKASQVKAEPDDWEDAADMSTPKLETSECRKQLDGDSKICNDDSTGTMMKKYSRDFLLKFAEQCTDVPEGFEIASDFAEALMGSSVNVSRESFPSPGRIVDRQPGGMRPDRRGSGISEEDKWSKLPGPLVPGRDMRPDIGYGNVMGFRPGQGGNFGALRNPRAQTPIQYAGGILSGPLQSFGPQGGVQRNTPDSDRWQRGTAFQRGLMPSPQTPLQVMHKAEKKYEVGKITDEEQAKQRQLKGILNKLTPQNFEKLFEQVKQVNIDNAITLTNVIAQIFDKALMEPTFCEMYANFCFHLAAELPDLSVDNEKITFKRVLLNKCQEEFERGEREEEEANKADVEGETKQSVEEREEKRIKARRRMLGNIRLIGELYKKRMLTERIMHECIKKLLGDYQNPDEENVEALCKLMSTIGEMIDHAKAKDHMDYYFELMENLSNNMRLSSRVRFMLKDAIDLRRNKWQQRRKVEGPKKIEEVHRDAAQERQAQTSRLARTPSMGSSIRRGQPMDFAPRGPSMLNSPGSQMAGFRGIPPQLRGYGAQDVRMDERHPFENRTLSVPLPQRPLGDETITLGPQGGLARGMAFRQPSAQSIPLADMSSTGDSRRMGSGMNGYSSIPERPAYGSREDLVPRYAPERFVSPSVYDQSGSQERNVAFGREPRTTDRGFDRSLPSSPPTRGAAPVLSRNASSDKMLSEEQLRDMSMAAIKEFYSANDENEVVLCIKDLNAPGFYPSMISLWVTDSFERKDIERDLLAKLLINLTRRGDGMISQDQLMKGFETVLAVLEDAVNDAPRAAEFLGRIFAKVVVDNVIPLHEVGRLIHEGGEEKGRLVEIGLAAEVLGSIMEMIKQEKGDSALNEIRSSSNLRLENFRPPGSNKSLRLDKFI